VYCKLVTHSLSVGLIFCARFLEPWRYYKKYLKIPEGKATCRLYRKAPNAYAKRPCCPAIGQNLRYFLISCEDDMLSVLLRSLNILWVNVYI
jgi:hypothetical protein